MGQLVVDYPNQPVGTPIEVPPYGMFENGTTTEVEAIEGTLTVPVPTAPEPVDESLTPETISQAPEPLQDAEPPVNQDQPDALPEENN